MKESCVGLQGGINLRQLGGLVMQDGRRIQPNRLFRSGALNRLTDQDLQRLSQLPLLTVLDYRDIYEAQRHPDRLVPGACFFNIPANSLSGDQINAKVAECQPQRMEQLDVDQFMVALYQRLPFHNPAWHNLIAQLYEQREGALLQHCAVGKDRTGIGVAITLWILGGDRRTIMQDYLATEGHLTRFCAETLARWPETATEHAKANFRQLLSVKRRWLLAAYQAVICRYASIDQWLKCEYGLTPGKIQQIRSQWLIE